MIFNDTYILEGSREYLAATLRCKVAEFNDALPNLKASLLGDVATHSNGTVTLVSRRLRREHIARVNGLNRVNKYRGKPPCNGGVPSPSVSASGSEGKRGPGEKGVHALSPAEIVLRDGELKRVRKRLAAIRDSYGDHQTRTKKESEEFTELLKRQQELKEILGVKI